MYNTPILFLIFARPDTTKRVFERIRQIQPIKLYIAADAPRKGRPEEIRRSDETKAIVEQIDWPCEVKKLYRETNLGCKMAVSSAISWFFEQEEYGVILEDDCLPDLSFFPYCEELLIKYKDDDRIGHIGGQSFFPKLIEGNLSYDFYSFAHIWGWATWRRVWTNYDVNFRFWQTVQKDKEKRRSLFLNLREAIYFSSFISDSLSGKNSISTWDTQYLYTLRAQNQLSIYPSVNMVTNIGLNSSEATHTKKNDNKYLIESKPMKFPLVHPTYIITNKTINSETIKKLYFSYKRTLRYILGQY